MILSPCMLPVSSPEPSKLLLIHQQPIVSSGTLRPDDLCSALIAECDRLGIILPRDLWQPAAAIAAHGTRGIVLDLPPRLNEIAFDVIAELFDALNAEAPDGCDLGSSEGDGALFLWSMSMEAQAQAINENPCSRFEAKTLTVPSHWLSAIVNGDESGLDDSRDCSACKALIRDEIDGWTVAGTAEDESFSAFHDATFYGVLACDTTEILLMKPIESLPLAKTAS